MVENIPKTGGVSSSQEKHKPAENQGLTENKADKSENNSAQNALSKVPTDVIDNTPNVQNNSKENDKEILSDPELSKLIAVWLGLSKAIRAGIMAMVRSSLNEKEEGR